MAAEVGWIGLQGARAAGADAGGAVDARRRDGAAAIGLADGKSDVDALLAYVGRRLLRRNQGAGACLRTLDQRVACADSAVCCDAMRSCDAMQAAEGVVALAAMLSYPVAHEASRLLLRSLHPRDLVLSAVRLVGRTAYPRALFQ